MLYRKETTYLKSLISQLVKASVDASWAGAMAPELRDMVRARPEQIQKKLDTYLEERTK
jgi:hypothetical protein